MGYRFFTLLGTLRDINFWRIMHDYYAELGIIKEYLVMGYMTPRSHGTTEMWHFSSSFSSQDFRSGKKLLNVLLTSLILWWGK